MICRGRAAGVSGALRMRAMLDAHEVNITALPIIAAADKSNVRMTAHRKNRRTEWRPSDLTRSRIHSRRRRMLVFLRAGPCKERAHASHVTVRSLGDHCRAGRYFDHRWGPCRLFTRNQFRQYAASPYTGNVTLKQYGLQGPEVGSAHQIMLGGDDRLILEFEGRLKPLEYGLGQMVVIGSMGPRHHPKIISRFFGL